MKVVHIPLAQVHYEGGPDVLGKRARLIVNGVNHFAGFSLGIVREGMSARQVAGGPKVPGPWAYAFGNATVIDNHGGTAGDIAREAAAARVHHADLGDLLEIDGSYFRIGPDHNDNVKLTLTPAPQ